MLVPLPNGEIVDTVLEPWQISFVGYMSRHSGLGREQPIHRMLQYTSDHSLFSGVVARTFRYAWEQAEAVGYNRCLEELLG